eukprot:6371010-Heterocapsa_arctica.AAC.1
MSDTICGDPPDAMDNVPWSSCTRQRDLPDTICWDLPNATYGKRSRLHLVMLGSVPTLCPAKRHNRSLLSTTT